MGKTFFCVLMRIAIFCLMEAKHGESPGLQASPQKGIFNNQHLPKKHVSVLVKNCVSS